MNIGSDSVALAPVREHLARWRGRAVYYHPLHGNHGDRLIDMGSRRLIRTLGLRLVPTPAAAQAILVNGGGGLCDRYPAIWQGVRRLCQEGRDKPLTILPSSVEFKEVDFGQFFAGRTAPAWVYLRERASLAHLKQMGLPVAVELRLDHDMALGLGQSDYLARLRRQCAGRHILVVERGDAESITTRYQPIAPWLTVKRFVPGPVRTVLRRRLMEHRARAPAWQTPFVRAQVDMVRQRHPELASLPVFAGDVSFAGVCSFARFGQLVAQAAAIVTTRLHVGILGALLEKPVYLKAGLYHKIAGVYEYSLAAMPNVRLI